MRHYPIILGYDPTLDPIPLFDPESARCWLGTGAMSCESHPRWALGDPIPSRCSPCPGRRQDLSFDLDPPCDNQQPLFGAPHAR